jgi:putative transposase
MEENITKSRTCTYNINYHVVWSVKYRKKIITPEIEKYLKETAIAVAADKGFTLHLFEAGECDHIHCFVSAPPKLSITDLVKYLKGITGRKLMDKYPELKTKLWKGELWNHSYYVETIGSVSEDNIRRYIEQQAKSY